MKADIGVVGLAVMGQNLVLNMADRGFTVAVYNRTVSKVDAFLQGSAKGMSILGAHTPSELASQLKKPRRIMLMVKAGDPVDDMIEHLLPFLEQGDILIDGGNSHFPDTERRCDTLKKKGFFFIGTGISGGEEGARHGPSIMPGGHKEAWPAVKPILQAIAARAQDGAPCCDWVGEGGAGHYVKMVHNGIEYGDMQLISESYAFLKRVGFTYPELAQTFSEWNRGPLNSYLIEISAEIFSKLDEDGSPLLEKILDVAGQKGTGKWTAIDALDRGIPLTLIGEAVFARCLSALKEERLEASRYYPNSTSTPSLSKAELAMQLAQALFAAKIMSYAQGFLLMQRASEEHQWHLNYGTIALLWRGGCIIRSQFLSKIKEAYDRNPKLKSLLLDPFFISELNRATPAWRLILSEGVLLGIPLPCLLAALSFFDGHRSSQLPANLLQAQRDYFGAHTYQRTDRPGIFHTNWTGTGGNVSSSTYNA